MKITKEHRKKLQYYLNEFYKRYVSERYTIFHFVRYFKDRLKKNKDAWIAVCGDTGSGKSYYTIIAMILFGRKMSLEDNICFLPEGLEIKTKFDKLEYNTLLVDEAAKEMRAVNWQSKAQQQVNVTAMTERYKRNMVFLNIPNFNELTKSMRRGSVQFRAIVLYREDLYARVIVQGRHPDFRNDDRWCDDLASEKYDHFFKQRKTIDNDFKLRLERSLPNYIMDFIVPNLEIVLPDVTTEYKRLKEESRQQQVAVVEDKKTSAWRTKYTALMAKMARLFVNDELETGKKLSRAYVSKILGVSPARVGELVDKSYEEDTVVR